MGSWCLREGYLQVARTTHHFGREIPRWEARVVCSRQSAGHMSGNRWICWPFLPWLMSHMGTGTWDSLARSLQCAGLRRWEGFSPVTLYRVWWNGWSSAEAPAWRLWTSTEWLQHSEYILPVTLTYIWECSRKDKSIISNHAMDDVNFSISASTSRTISLLSRGDDSKTLQ